MECMPLRSVNLHGVWRHYVISIWIQIWIWIWGALLVTWRHYIISMWIQIWIWIRSALLVMCRHYVISIWIQIWIWLQGVLSVTWRHYIKCTSIWSVNLNGVWRHSTLCNIHMDTNMDMDMEYGSTWSVEDTLYSMISIWTWIWLHVCK